MAKRFLLGALAVILLSGAATAAVALNEVSKLVEALKQNRPVKVAPHVLAPTSRGAPETLLLVGNDERKLTRYYHNEVLPHSNEMLLVRIDPSKPTISMLSIPRELKVPIDLPNGEVTENRINSAFTYGWENGGGTAGGVRLMLETIKRVLGITVNHVFVTNFTKFEHAVNDMGCVYMTVDKRYFHNNSELGAEQYMEINLQPGYQRVCGKQAREFVSNRHESTSLIRDARDQRFLLAVKAQYGGSIFEDREKFESIFGKYVQSTLNSEEEILQLLYLLAESAGKPTRQVDFHVNLGPSTDSATPEQIQEAVHSFLTGTAAIHKPRVVSTGGHASRHAHQHSYSAPGISLTPTTAAELSEARSQAPNLPFTLEYPRAREAFAGAEPDTLRLYDISDLHGHAHPTYVVVIDRGELGQYYDVQGSTWTDPPFLSNPGQTVHLGARTYELFYAGEHVTAIAWHEENAVYWIENTLTNDISPQAMLAIAEQTQPVFHTNAPTKPVTITAAEVNLNPRSATATSLIDKIGSLLGFLGLGVMALLSVLVLVRQRELRHLREQVANALALEAHQRRLLAAAGVAPPRRAPAAIAPAAGKAAPTSGIDALTPAVYHTRKLPRRTTLALLGGVIALAGAGAVLLQAGPSAPPKPAGPPVPVAVFNATAVSGLAHRIADTLKSGHIQVNQIGDINASLRPGTYVLYPRGQQQEAQRVALLIPTMHPTVGPIRRQVATAVGHHNEIVIVLD